METGKKVLFLEKQLKEEKVVRNQAEKDRVELEVSWVQTNQIWDI